MRSRSGLHDLLSYATNRKKLSMFSYAAHGKKSGSDPCGGLSRCFAADWQLKGLNLIFQEDRVGVRVRVRGREGVQLLGHPTKLIEFFRQERQFVEIEGVSSMRKGGGTTHGKFKYPWISHSRSTLASASHSLPSWSILWVAEGPNMG